MESCSNVNHRFAQFLSSLSVEWTQIKHNYSDLHSSDLFAQIDLASIVQFLTQTLRVYSRHNVTALFQRARKMSSRASVIIYDKDPPHTLAWPPSILPFRNRETRRINSERNFSA